MGRVGIFPLGAIFVALGLLFPASSSMAEGSGSQKRVAAKVKRETIQSALAHAYLTSPDLAAQRAAVRATDEGLAKAISGYRPTLNGNISVGRQYLQNDSPLSGQKSGYTTPRSGTLQMQQMILSGGRVGSAVDQSQAQILQAREQLRLSEITLLLNASTAYMDVLRDTAILSLKENNVLVLEEQLKQTQDRFRVGEITNTDVAQAQAALSQGKADTFLAQANLKASLASYRQYVGSDPQNLQPTQALDRMLPPKLEAALVIADRQHPQILAAIHGVDAAKAAAQLAESQLNPSLSAQGQVSKAYDAQNVQGQRNLIGTVTASLNIPLYQGGGEYAGVRQAKELVSQSRLQVDLARDQVRSRLVAAWGSYETAQAVIRAQEAAVHAAEVALKGVREEAKVGQRTTLDVLNAQQTLLNARVSLVSAQRDHVVQSYTVLADMGQLEVVQLGLNVDYYRPEVHYEVTKDRWIGSEPALSQ